MAVVLSIDGVDISSDRFSGPFYFKAAMQIDADGAPTAYHPVSGKGLDKLANAGHPGNWYGVVTNTGKMDGVPIVQGPSDPAPGFFVSPTALQDRLISRTSPKRYVDSSKVPYISLPGHHSDILHAALGDLAVVVNSRTGRYSGAIFADVGPRKKIGEGSIALARALGLSDNARHGGTSSRSIIYVVFPRSGTRRPMAATAIQARAQSLFQAWGGIAQVRSCFPDLAPNMALAG